MVDGRRGLIGGLTRWASTRRFPTLLALTGTVFLIDLVVPDVLPVADELFLGLATLALARWKEERTAAHDDV